MYQKLFSPGKIGSVELKNRIVMTAMGVGLAEADGRANDDIIAYYEARAKGGTGLIITEITRIDEETGIGCPNQLGATRLDEIGGLQRLAETVHKYDTKIFAQLHHPGRQNQSRFIEGRQVVAPSPIMCKVSQQEPRALTTEECEAMVAKFITGAVICQTAGLDGVEIHGAHGYLIDQFLSPYTNQRTDKYGGSFENRFRILAEIVTGIRSACGDKFGLSVRLSVDEFVEGGLKLEDSIQIAKELEKLGVDCINVSSGIYESSTTIVEPASFPQGWKKHLAAGIKANVSIPVIAVCNIKDPDVAEGLLEEGACDFIGLGRAHLADAEWACKAASGKADEITKCIGCLYCFQSLGMCKHILCAVNPTTGRERELLDYKRNGNGQTVAVVGGGPGGMQAALVLKERGFNPVIFEKKDTLGGTLNVADKPILKEKMTAYCKSKVAQVEAAGIEVCLNTEATVENVKAINPVAVFMANGGTPIIPKIDGIDGANVVTAEDVLLGKAQVSGKVAVIGGGMTGLETAETLSSQGKEVTLVEMLPEVGAGLYKAVLFDTLNRISKFEVPTKILTGHKLLAVKEHEVETQNLADGQVEKVAADTVILAMGVRPGRDLVEKFQQEFDRVILIGDCNKAGKIAEAVVDGQGKALAFEA